MKVLICGGRDYQDKEKIFQTLDAMHNATPISLVVHGAARGADLLGEEWAKSREIAYYGVPAKWQELGRKAGPLRNLDMLARITPDLVIAFPGGRGTDNMIKLASCNNIKVKQIEP